MTLIRANQTYSSNRLQRILDTLRTHNPTFTAEAPRTRNTICKAEALLNRVQEACNMEKGWPETLPLDTKTHAILNELDDSWDEEEVITLPGISAMVDFEYTQYGPVYRPKNQKLSVTPLLLAAAERRDAVICVLLAFSNINQQSDSGITALFMALYYGQVNTAKMLLRQGADVKACGFNALHAAARSGSCDMITHLVEDCHVDVNVEDCDGATALFYALQQPEDEALETILHMQCLGLLKDAKLDCCWTFEEIARAMGKQSLTSVFEVDKE